jgi:phage repressor protein C with HTH and peptisase S24 domain
MSEALRGNKRALGYKHTEETRKKTGVWQEGKVLTEETKEKIGEAAKGNKRWLGKHHSPDTKEKLRAANVGKHASEETRRKMGEAQKKRQANKRLKMVSL